MQKHVLDRAREDSRADLRRVIQAAKSALPSRVTLALQRRGRPENAALRTQHFLRIARGGSV